MKHAVNEIVFNDNSDESHDPKLAEVIQAVKDICASSDPHNDIVFSEQVRDYLVKQYVSMNPKRSYVLEYDTPEQIRKFINGRRLLALIDSTYGFEVSIVKEVFDRLDDVPDRETLEQKAFFQSLASVVNEAYFTKNGSVASSKEITEAVYQFLTNK